MKLSDLDKIKKVAAEFERLAKLEDALSYNLSRLEISTVFVNVDRKNEYAFTQFSGVDLPALQAGVALAVVTERKRLQTQLMMMGVTDFEGKV